MNELVRIPSGERELFGVVHPARDASGPRRKGVVVFYDDLSSSFGTHNLYRKVAEAFAARGYWAIRHDNYGVCDSPGVRKLEFPMRVEEALDVVSFFRERYRIDDLYFWGLCIGAATAVHTQARLSKKDGPLAMVLCNVLSDYQMVSDPELGFKAAEVSPLLKNMFLTGNIFKKLLYAPTKIDVYRKNYGRVLKAFYWRYVKKVPHIEGLRQAIREVPNLLVRTEHPTLLMFSELDAYRRNWFAHVNQADQLGLSHKRPRMDWYDVKNGNHTFASASQTQEAIRVALEWLDALAAHRDPGPYFSFAKRIHGDVFAPTAE